MEKADGMAADLAALTERPCKFPAKHPAAAEDDYTNWKSSMIIPRQLPRGAVVAGGEREAAASPGGWATY